MTASATHAPRRRRLDGLDSERSAPSHRAGPIESLARYTDEARRMREVIASRGPGGSVLVLDRDLLDRGEQLLVAHLGPDEPAGNAALVCERYIGDSRRGRCRRVTPDDFAQEPFALGEGDPAMSLGELHRSELVDRQGEHVHRLEVVDGGGLLQLRWCRRPCDPRQGGACAVSLREVVGALESYEPARRLTRASLAHYREDRHVATGALRDELTRLSESPIVLNRKLREAALAAVESGRLSMGEIALRCGRAKRCRNGKLNGETSWLARRLGLRAESGATRPSPWIHSDVLALIARAGIGVSPCEVEL
jgi:hypothetical protein